jgi:hypothetical protein
MDVFNVAGMTWSDLAAWAMMTSPAYIILAAECAWGRLPCW